METVEEMMSRLRRDGYLAYCHTHGNQTFPYHQRSEHFLCRGVEWGECVGEVCDFRVCTHDGPGHNGGVGMIFWGSGPWQAGAVDTSPQ